MNDQTENISSNHTENSYGRNGKINLLTPKLWLNNQFAGKKAAEGSLEQSLIFSQYMEFPHKEIDKVYTLSDISTKK